MLNDQEIREVLGLVQRLADQKTDPATFHDLISQATPLLSRIDPSKELAPEHRSSFERTRKELADWGRGSVLHVAGVQLTAGPILAALQSLLRPPSPASQQTQSSKSRKSTRKRNGDWEVRQKIGEGGQGWVYEVRNAKDGKIGAMKVLKNAERAKRFRREVEACLKLDHRYIAKHLDHDLQASRPYLVTEYCEGKTLAELNREAMSLVDKLDLFRKICEGMALAHSSNVVHRDLKPANILFHGNGDPKVADFGICYLMDDPERLTETGEAVGPRLYMAPELEDGRLEKVSAKCDVYSLGKILYFILSGRYFSREKHREDEFDLSKMVTENTAALCHVYDLLDKSIVREPEQRFADAKELLLSVNATIRLIELKAHFLDLRQPQACAFCGKGILSLAVDNISGRSPASLQNFGFRPAGGASGFVLVCDYCGNVQWFRPSWYDKPSNWRGAPGN